MSEATPLGAPERVPDHLPGQVAEHASARADRPHSGRRRTGRLASLLAAACGLVAVVLWPSLPPNGPVLLRVISPAPGAVVGLGGIDLLVEFPPEGPTVWETFRALLNGADVTDQLTIGENGCQGQLVDLLPGENVLRLEVFGRVPWAPDRLFEQAHEIRLRMRPPIDLDRG
jgi:hypothetical protein